MWSSAWLLAGEVPGGAWGRLLALSRSAQVDREVPALGKDFAAASALHLMTAVSLAREAAWEFFLETSIWLTTSANRTRPESLSWREGVERSKVFTFVQENCSSVKKTGDRESCRKDPRSCAWMQVKKWRAPSVSLQNWHSAVVASLNFCNCSEWGSKSLQSLKSVDF